MSDKDYLKQIGLELRIARMRKALKQDDVVRMTGITMGALSRLEQGKANGKILNYRRIAEALGISLKEIV